MSKYVPPPPPSRGALIFTHAQDWKAPSGHFSNNEAGALQDLSTLIGTTAQPGLALGMLWQGFSVCSKLQHHPYSIPYVAETMSLGSQPECQVHHWALKSRLALFPPHMYACGLGSHCCWSAEAQPPFPSTVPLPIQSIMTLNLNKLSLRSRIRQQGLAGQKGRKANDEQQAVRSPPLIWPCWRVQGLMVQPGWHQVLPCDYSIVQIYQALEAGNLDMPVCLDSGQHGRFTNLRQVAAIPFQQQLSMFHDASARIVNAMHLKLDAGDVCDRTLLRLAGRPHSSLSSDPI